MGRITLKMQMGRIKLAGKIWEIRLMNRVSNPLANEAGGGDIENQVDGVGNNLIPENILENVSGSFKGILGMTQIRRIQRTGRIKLVREIREMGDIDPPKSFRGEN